ncbi:GAF domain-containing protein [Glycomyces sp. L485]|uniref:GAF domain-containing protein n=1 Tax=Glycomyces sp. L485 TaxID=2909235 RepID=UPI001F4A782C|nr:GAF domain-containing protein [Glycomyces sp. L485]MCH7232164.1 GAF domain-containing protein [Glycomyces sp. L485]
MMNQHGEILRSTVRLARLAFSAAAASVFLYDEERGMLVFEASSGIGEEFVLGAAIAPDAGVAGWVANTGESAIIRGAASDPRFDTAFARGTGFVPDVLMAAPVEFEGEVLGVLEVLDPKSDTIGGTSAVDLLTELAGQCGAALALILQDRAAQRRRAEPDGAVERLAQVLDRLNPAQETAVNDLFEVIERLTVR